MIRAYVRPIAGLFALGACGDSIKPASDRQADPVANADASTSDELPDDRDNSPREATIDASNESAWVYFDLESGKVVTPPSPDRSTTWDLAFQRFSISVNGGVSGSGGVEVSVIDEASFDDVTTKPSSGYAADAADGADDDTDPEYVMSTGDTGWYDYDPTSHTLAPRAHVYVLRSAEGNHFKLAVLDYYNEAGSSGYPRLKWQRLDGDAPSLGADAGWSEGDDASTNHPNEPDASSGELDGATSHAGFDTFEVPATSTDAWVYVKVGQGVVSIAEPASSLDWDLAFQRTNIQTNSGTSGQGMGGARVLDGEFASQTAAPGPDGFESDAQLPISGRPGSGELSGNPVLGAWYDYDLATHVVSPKATAYVLRTASGGYAKLRITAYAGGTFTLDLGKLGE